MEETKPFVIEKSQTVASQTTKNNNYWGYSPRQIIFMILAMVIVIVILYIIGTNISGFSVKKQSKDFNILNEISTLEKIQRNNIKNLFS